MICPCCEVDRKLTNSGRFVAHTSWKGAGFRPERCPASQLTAEQATSLAADRKLAQGEERDG